MADRIVSWRAVADFSRVRREAKATERALRDLQAAERSANDSSVDSTARVEQAQRRRTASTQNASRAAEQAAAREAAANQRRTRSTEESARASEEAARQEQAAAQARQRTIAGLLEAARRQTQAEREIQATRSTAARSASSSAAAETQLTQARNAHTQATIASERAQLRLEAARARLTAVTNNTKSSEEDLARAHLNVQDATLGAERASARLQNAVSRLGSASAKASGGSGFGGLGRSIAGAVGDFGKGERAIASFIQVFSIFSLFQFSAIGTAMGVLTSSIGALAGALVGLVSAVRPAIGALAALPQVIGTAGFGIGTLITGFSGIGTALKAYGKQQKTAAADTGKAAKATTDYAAQIREAGYGLRDAYEAQGDAAKNAARNVQQAQQRIADANDNVIDSERDLSDAQKAARQAQLDVTRAREDAIQTLKDLRNEVRDTALSEEDASLSLEEARQRLAEVNADPGSTDLQRRQAALNIRQAEARLDDAKQASADAVKDQKDAADKGVENSDIVVAAKEREADANRGVIDSQKSLTRAQQEAGAAQSDLADVQVEAFRSQRDAAEAVVRAQEALTKAQKQQSVDAAAAAGASSAAATAANEYAKAMAALSPAARSFVEYLTSLIPQLKKFRSATQQAMFPGFEAGLRALEPLFPVIQRGLELFGGAIGGLVQSLGQLLGGDFGKGVFERQLESSQKILPTLSSAVVNLAEAFLRLLDNARPLTEAFANAILTFSNFLLELTKDPDQSWVQDTITTFGKLLDIVQNTGSTISGFLDAARPLGDALLDSIIRITDQWDKWVNSPEGQERLTTFFNNLQPLISEVTGLIGDLVVGFFELFEKNTPASTELIGQIRDDLLPAVFDLLGLFGGEFGSAFVSFLTSAADLIGKLMGGTGGGGLLAFVESLTMVLDLLGKIAGSSVGQAALPVIGGLLAAGGVVKAGKVVSEVSGIGGLARGAVRASDNANTRRGTPNAGIVSGLRGAASDARERATNNLGLRRADPNANTIGPLREGEERGQRAGIVRRAGGALRNRVRSVTGNDRGSVRLPGATDEDDAQRRPGASGGAPAGDDTPAQPTRRRRVAGAVGRGAGRGAGAATALAGTGLLGENAATAASVASIAGDAGVFTGLQKAALAAGPVIGKVVGNLTGVFKAFGGVLGTVAKAVGGALTSIVKVVGLAIGTITKLMLANPWILLIVALIAIVVLVVKYWDEISAFIGKAMSVIGGYIQKGWDKIKEVFTNALNAVVNFIKDNWKILLLLTGPLGIAILLIVKHWDAIKETFNKAVDFVVGFVKDVWGGIVDLLGEPISKAWDFIKSVFELIKTGVKLYFEAYIAVIKFIWNLVKDIIINPIKEAWATVLAGLIIVGQWLKTKFNEFVQGVKIIWALIKDIIIKPIKEAWDTVESNLKGAWDRVKSGFQGLVDGVKGVWDTIQDIVSKPVRFIIDTVLNSWLIPAFNGVMKWLGINKEIPTISTSSAGSSTKSTTAKGGAKAMAAGGRVPGTGNADSVPAMLMPGEFVIRKKAAAKIGMGQLQRLNHAEKYAVGGMAGVPLAQRKKSPSVGGVQHFFLGGLVDGLSSVVSRGVGLAGDVIGGAVNLAKEGAAGGLSSLFAPLLEKVTSNSSGLGDFSDVIGGSVRKVTDEMINFMKGAEQIRGSLTGGDFDRSGKSTPNGKGGLGPMAAAARAYVMKAFGISNIGGYADRNIAGTKQLSDHALGKAIDVMIGNYKTGAGIAKGNSVASYFVNNPGAYGTKYVIWNGQINSGTGWRTYSHPGGGTSDTLLHKDHVHVSFFNKGGLAGRGGSLKPHAQDTVPAMLTPGEFVVNRDAVKRIGLSNLMRLNQGGAKPESKMALGTQYFHEGGYVNGFYPTNPNNNGRAVAALRWLMNMSINGQFDPTLVAKLREGFPKPLAIPAAADNDVTRMLTAITKLNAKTPNNVSWDPLLAETGWSPYKLLRTFQGGREKIADLGDVGKRMMADGEFWLNNYNGDMIELAKITGQSNIGDWTSLDQTQWTEPLYHVLDHALGIAHDKYLARPWDPMSAAESAAGEKVRSNEITKEFQGYLDTLASQGYMSLVEELQKKGAADGLAIAKDAASSPSKAAELEKAYAEGSTLDATDNAAVTKMIAGLSKFGSDAGLRKMATLLKVPDYAVLSIFEKNADRIRKTGVFTGRLEQDIAKFRAGTFYANTGGKVPGTGNGDTVPAMLTPGEFVLRKQAAKALGLGNLMTLNNAQHFANGGPVLSPTLAGLPNIGTVNVSGVRSAAGGLGGTSAVTTNINTTIHNPVAEKSTLSMNKMLQRKALMGVFDPNLEG